MSKSIQIARRREQVQRLLVRGLSAAEIARSVEPPVDERTIQRDIAWIRREQESWFRENSQVKTRMMRFLKERIDALKELGKEGWLVAYEAKEDLKARVSGLNIVLGSEKLLNELMGFTRLSMADIEVRDKMERLDVEIAEIRRIAGLAENNTLSA